MNFFRILTDVIHQLLKAAATSLVAVLGGVGMVLAVVGVAVVAACGVCGLGGLGLAMKKRKRD